MANDGHSQRSAEKFQGQEAVGTGVTEAESGGQRNSANSNVLHEESQDCGPQLTNNEFHTLWSHEAGLRLGACIWTGRTGFRRKL